jgi:hypothetical protein
MYAIQDAEGRFIGQSRSLAAAHRATRTRKHVGTRVERHRTGDGDLGLADVTEAGHRFVTGLPVSFTFFHNTEKAPLRRGADQFQQGIEPAGYYMVLDDSSGERALVSGWIRGQASFRSPLVLVWNTGSGGYDEQSWKVRLSRAYGGKKGMALSRAILRAGYDAIVTVQGRSTSEIVDLGVGFRICGSGGSGIRAT